MVETLDNKFENQSPDHVTGLEIPTKRLIRTLEYKSTQHKLTSQGIEMLTLLYLSNVQDVLIAR